MNFETNEWDITDVCYAAAIYGLDGAAWAWSPNFPELLTYDYEQEDMAGNTTKVSVNEVNCAIGAAEGKRNPSDAGIRLGNEKYMFVTHDESDGVTQLSTRGGGAAVKKINTAVIVAMWKKDSKQSNGFNQAGGDCASQVSVMGAYLAEQGY